MLLSSAAIFRSELNWRSVLIHCTLYAFFYSGLILSVKNIVDSNYYFLKDALFFCTAAVSIFLAVFYRRELRKREIIAIQLEERLVCAEIQALDMQLHPHFLFNALQAISTMIYTDAETADRMIARLGDLLRLALDNMGEMEVPLKHELDFLERYLEIERTRFDDRLTVRMDIDPEALNARVPNLLLQPLVENAIRHGIAACKDKGRIEIRAQRRDDMLELRVRDNGPGLPENKKLSLREGIGLSNARARLRQLHGSRHRFDLRNAKGGGLVVSLSIPFSV
jgi:two-component system, LytTR family, sensor kinase